MPNKITYDKYVSFINGVVENTISDGIEYKNFYLALMFAIVFMDYKIVNIDKNGNIDIVKEWDNLDSIKFKCGNDQTSLTDFILSDYFSTIIELPIQVTVYSDMVRVINEKLDHYYTSQANITPLNTSFSILIDTITDFINNMKNQFKGVDMANLVPVMTDLTKNIKDIDKKAFAETLANRIHDENKNTKVSGDTNDQ
ncbi:MAG: hypothetical protein K2F81_08825 [Ruminococcus sp.]|nr:hypothetical protein [Ruminococcus sp.]